MWEDSCKTSLSGKLYYVSFIDNYSIFCVDWFLHTQVWDLYSFQKLENLNWDSFIGHKMRYLHTINDSKYNFEEFWNYNKE